jgi:hypothetical protein
MFKEWCLNKQYKIGDKISYNKNYYKCIEQHTSFIEYGTPSDTNGILWSDDEYILENENVTLWRIGQAYKKGDVIKFDTGAFYYCIKHHISNIMNSPPHTRDVLWNPIYINYNITHKL